MGAWVRLLQNSSSEILSCSVATEGRHTVKPASLAGLVLIVLGVIALAYQGITYTTHKKVLDVGPIQASKTETHTIPLPPIIGGIALVGGVSLLVMGSKDN